MYGGYYYRVKGGGGMQKQKKALRRFGKDGAAFLIGSVAFGTAVSVFNEPNHFAPGGVSGLAVLLGYLTDAPAGTVTLILNVPLLILAYRRVGRSFFWRTVAGLLLSSVAMDVMRLILPPFTGDRLLAAVFGGVLTGVGLGLIYMRGGSTGGAEIVATLLRRRLRFLSVGNLMLLVDAAVILLSAVVYRSVDSALYATVAVFLSTQVMDRLVYGGKGAMVALIISERSQAVSDAILTSLSRGVTKLPAVGAYRNRGGSVLLCAVGKTEVYRLRELVLGVDPAAFTVLLTAEEVLGSGFEEGEQLTPP